MDQSFMPKQDNRGLWWIGVIRFLAGCMAPILWYVSFTFSVKGFAFFLPEWIWVGQIFGVVFTILELMFNRGVAKHPTLFYAGVVAYAYSIGTNALGLFTASDLTTIHGPILILSSLMLIILAFALDILPEAMLVWAFYPNDPIITGDLVSSLMRGVHIPSPVQDNRQRTNVPNMRSNRPSAVYPKYSGASMDDLLDVQDELDTLDRQGKVGQLDSNWTNSKVTRAIRGYVHSHRGSHGEAPSVRQVAAGIKEPPSSVGLIMKKMRERGEIKG